MRHFKKGQIVLDDYGRELEITSGNDKKWPNDYLKMINEPYLRVRLHKPQLSLIPKQGENGQDFLWYVNRIKKILKK